MHSARQTFSRTSISDVNISNTNVNTSAQIHARRIDSFFIYTKEGVLYLASVCLFVCLSVSYQDNSESR